MKDLNISVVQYDYIQICKELGKRKTNKNFF